MKSAEDIVNWQWTLPKPALLAMIKDIQQDARYAALTEAAKEVKRLGWMNATKAILALRDK